MNKEFASQKVVHTGLLYFLLFLTLMTVGAKMGYIGDMNYWVSWAKYIHINGLSNAYDAPENNYNPGYQYILWLYSWLAGSEDAIYQYRHFLKAFTLIFDIAGAVLAASLIKDQSQRFTSSLLLLLNAGYLYNTVAWGQIDSIYTFFVFAAVVLAARDKIVWSVLAAVLALNIKLQAIIFLPALLMLWGPTWVKAPRNILPCLLGAAALQFAILFPFMYCGYKNHLDRIVEVTFKAVDYYPFISMNSFNFWYLLLGDQVPGKVDRDIVSGFTYKQWGIYLFFASSFVVLLPMFVRVVYNLVKRRWQDTNLPLTLATFAALPLVFCFFNTQMHERYWHPAILFLGAYGLVSGRYLAYVVSSIAYFLNLEMVLRSLELPKDYKFLIFHPQFIAALFLLAIIVCVVNIYREAQLGQLFAKSAEQVPLPKTA